MKTLKKVPIELVEVENVPADLEEGKFYYSKEYNIAVHLCVCGCKQKHAIRIKQNEWNIQQTKPLTVTPSLHHRIGCKTHYIITNGFANIV